MIRNKALFCKIFSINISTYALFAEFMKGLDLKKTKCPHCKSTGNFKIHGYYRRHVVEFIGNTASDSIIRVMRVRCTSCRHTHAVLPDFIVPYRSYGLIFILKCLSEHFSHIKSIYGICEAYGISRWLFLTFRKTYLKHKALFLGHLMNNEKSASSFLSDIVDNSNPSEFLSEFMLKCGFSFMQSHRINTAGP